MEHTTNTPQGKVTIKYSANNPFLMGLDESVKNHRSKVMDRKSLSRDELSTVYIGETGVTVMDVVTAFGDALHSMSNIHDLSRATGMSLDQCEEIFKVRKAVYDIWLKPWIKP